MVQAKDSLFFFVFLREAKDSLLNRGTLSQFGPSKKWGPLVIVAHLENISRRKPKNDVNHGESRRNKNEARDTYGRTLYTASIKVPLIMLLFLDKDLQQ